MSRVLWQALLFEAKVRNSFPVSSLFLPFSRKEERGSGKEVEKLGEFVMFTAKLI